MDDPNKQYFHIHIPNFNMPERCEYCNSMKDLKYCIIDGHTSLCCTKCIRENNLILFTSKYTKKHLIYKIKCYTILSLILVITIVVIKYNLMDWNTAQYLLYILVLSFFLSN